MSFASLERREAWVMGYVAGAATILANGMPVILGALAVDRHLLTSELGTFGSAGFLGQLGGVASAFFWIHRVNWRHIARSCVGGALCACAVMACATSPWLLFASSCAVGAFTGACYGLALAFWGAARNSTRAVSIGVLNQVLLASLFLYVVPAILTPRFGMLGGPALMGALLLPIVPLGRLMPSRTPNPAPAALAAHGAPAGRTVALVGLTLMGIYYVGIFALWSFLDRIGAAAGLSADSIGIALSISMLVGALALVFTGILGERWGLLGPLVISFALYAVFFALLLRPQTTALYTVALTIFNFAWNVGLPYQISITARGDPSGRLIVLMPAFQAAGAACGPYLAGELAGGGQFTAAYWMLGASVITSSVGYGALAHRRSHP
jgi:hypothetical protein